MKTVLHFIESMGRGGAERVILNALKSNTNYKNILVLMKDHNLFEEQLVKTNTETIVLGYDRKEKQQTANKLAQVIKEKKVDIVHAHLQLAILIARMGTPKDVKLIFTVHNNYKHKFLRSPILFLREKKYSNNNQVGIFVSKDAQDFYTKSIGFKGESHVLYNFIDKECFEKERYSFRNEKGPLKLIAAGNLRHQKQHVFLIKALRKLDKTQYRLTIYGEGKLRKKLTKLIQKYGLEENIFMPGSIPNDEVLSEMVQNDLFVMPSLYEGWGLALSEAIILGMPCLVSDIAPFIENAEDAVMFHKQGNVNDFISKIKKIIADRSILLAYHKKTSKRATEYLTSEEYAEKLNSIYR